MTTNSAQPGAQQKRVRVEYTADFASKLDRIIEKQTMLEVSLGELRAGIMPRHEIDAEIDKRVSLTGYLSDKTAIESRLKSLEEAPSANWSRGGVIAATSVGCLSLIVSCTSILVMILIATKII